jgi:hypothetical protein
VTKTKEAAFRKLATALAAGLEVLARELEPMTEERSFPRAVDDEGDGAEVPLARVIRFPERAEA